MSYRSHEQYLNHKPISTHSTNNQHSRITKQHKTRHSNVAEKQDQEQKAAT